MSGRDLIRTERPRHRKKERNRRVTAHLDLGDGDPDARVGVPSVADRRYGPLHTLPDRAGSRYFIGGAEGRCEDGACEPSRALSDMVVFVRERERANVASLVLLTMANLLTKSFPSEGG